MAEEWEPPCAEEPETFFAPDFETEAEPYTKEWYTDAGRLAGPVRERELRAQLICLGCPFIEECAELGRDEEHGVWGSTTPEERKRLRRGLPIRSARVMSRSGHARRRMAELFLQGLSIDEVAEMLGTKRRTVLRQLNEEVAVSTQRSGDVALAS